MNEQDIQYALMKSLTKISPVYYTIDVVLNRDRETVTVHKDSIPLIIRDILYLHPTCSLYAESVNRLLDEEEKEGLFLNQPRLEGKYRNLDLIDYFDLRRDLLNLDTPVDPMMYQKLRDIGYNPTASIDYDNKTRFHLNNLLSKRWMTRSDTMKGKTKDDIVSEMILALEEPEPFINSRYLSSVISYYKE